MKFFNWLVMLGLATTLGCSTSSSSSSTPSSGSPTAPSGSSSPTPPAPPSGPGRIELTVSPNSVSYAGGAGVGGPICPVPDLSRWGPFVWTIRETNGGEVTITSFTYVVRTISGNEIANDEIVAGISRDFTGTVAPTLRVTPNATLSSRTHYDCERETNGRPNFPGGTAVFTASGTNEAGGAVSSTATLTLLPPP